MYVCMHAYKHACMYIYVYMYGWILSIYMYVCMYIFTHVCV